MANNKRKISPESFQYPEKSEVVVNATAGSSPLVVSKQYGRWQLDIG
jgi:hypothetical protein